MKKQVSHKGQISIHKIKVGNDAMRTEEKYFRRQQNEKIDPFHGAKIEKRHLFSA